jgi:peptidoglycan/xylan/chitin deacetylase (PgdA/CDA1 family)
MGARLVAGDGIGRPGGRSEVMGMVTRQIRDVLYRTAWITGLTKLLERRARGGVTILMYHRVLPRELGSRYLHGLSVTPEVFEAQLHWLAERANVLPVSPALERMGSKALGGARPTVCITFDDGYWDNAAIAAPILDAHHMRATFFIATASVLGGKMLWFDLAADLWARDPGACAKALRESSPDPAPPTPGSFANWMDILKTVSTAKRLQILRYAEQMRGVAEWSDLNKLMTVSDARAMISRGHEIGSHSVTHPILTQLDDQSLATEFVASKQELENSLGPPIAGFCYPNGSADSRVMAAARAAGYTYACTTRPGLNEATTDPFALLRNHVHQNTVTDNGGSHSGPSFAAVAWGLNSQIRRGLGFAG